MPPIQRDAGRTPARTDSAGARTLLRGMPVRQLLRLSTLDGTKVLAGAEGLDRMVRRINMMTTPEIVPWVQENELLLTTSYPLPRDPDVFAGLVTELDVHDLASLGVKLGKYIDRIPAAVLRRADELAFPLLEIPHQVRFDDIVSQVLTDIANRQAAILTRSEEVNRAFVQIVLDGGGLTEITDELAGLLGNAVAVLDGDDRILAETGLAAVRGRLAALGILDADERLRLDEYTALFEGAYEPGPDGTAPRDADPLRPRIGAYPISTGALRLGRIVVIETGGPLPDDTLIIQERAATVAALDMTKKLAVAAVERKYQSDFLHDLLVGRGAPQRDAVARGRVLGWELDGPLAVIVAERHPEHDETGLPAIERDRRQARLSDAWLAAVHTRDRTAAAAAFGDELVAIVRAACPANAIGELASDVAEGMAVVRQRLCYGVSRAVPDLAQLPEAYRQAGRAVKFGAATRGPGEVTLYDGLGVFRLLSVIEDTEELRSFVSDTLGPVLGRGERESDDLLNTLTVLIDCNLNAAAAAKELHFHYNTVRYRIAKLERLLGPFTFDRHLCQRLSIALQIMQIHDLRR
ncbi:MAG: PucR family transcriptional regulator [Streptosporangiales bacterium]|nr:PucR family transcriptional regulator [Streptosporangiales bacterium]